MWQFTVDNSIGLYENPKFEFKNGINVIIGPNGTGKSFLLARMQENSDYEEDIDYLVVSYSNLRDGGQNATSKFGYEDDLASLAYMITSSEGQGMYKAFGEQFFKRMGSKLMKEAKKDKKRNTLVITLDAMDSGLDIYSMREILEVFEKTIIDDLPKHYDFLKNIIIIISTNAYEFVRNREVIDVFTGKTIKFNSYEEYADHIMKTKEKILIRNERLEKEEEQRHNIFRRSKRNSISS